MEELEKVTEVKETKVIEQSSIDMIEASLREYYGTDYKTDLLTEYLKDSLNISWRSTSVLEEIEKPLTPEEEESENKLFKPDYNYARYTTRRLKEVEDPTEYKITKDSVKKAFRGSMKEIKDSRVEIKELKNRQRNAVKHSKFLNILLAQLK